MSKSRKLNFRANSRPPPQVTKRNLEPVPLANKFQELVEQDEPSVHRRPVIQAPNRNVATTTMAQRLQNLLGESEEGNRRSTPGGLEEQDLTMRGVQRSELCTGGESSRGPEQLRNDESEALDSDNSDDCGLARNSPKFVPMAQRLQALLAEEDTASRRRLPMQKRPAKVVPDLKVQNTDDDIEVCGSVFPQVPSEPPIMKAYPLPSMAEQFQEALMADPSFGSLSMPSIQFSKDHDSSYSSRLQRILQQEKLKHAQLTKELPSHHPSKSIQVQILSKSLEGRLTTCKCRVVQAPSQWIDASSVTSSIDTVEVIFNAKVALELELDVGDMVLINPPWQEITLLEGLTKVILCTYFCQRVC